jgi:protein TonB
MKNFLVLILICFVQNTFAQGLPPLLKAGSYTTEAPVGEIQPNTNDNVYNTSGIDVKPEFPGGINEFYKYIAKNYIIPKEKPVSVKGKVYATFIIEKDGSLNDVKILRDCGFGTGQETIRVLKLSPKWIPGKLKNKEVRVLYSLPIIVN